MIRLKVQPTIMKETASTLANSASACQRMTLDGETVPALADAPAFEHLQHFDSWHSRNVNEAYL